MRIRLLCFIMLVCAAAAPAGAEVTTAERTDRLRQGAFIGQRAGTAQLPETVTLRFDWNGIPLLGTFLVRSGERWVSQGRAVDLSQVGDNVVLSVPAAARLYDLTFGGSVGAGEVASVDRARRIVRVRLPDGDTRALRYAPEALFVVEGGLASLDRLLPGTGVLFEVPPDGNRVGIFTAVGAGRQATISGVGDEAFALRFTGGDTRTYSVEGDTYFFRAGQPVLVESFPAGFRTGDTVWVYGSTDNPRYIVGGVGTGFETAQATPAEISATVSTPTVAVGEMPASTPAGLFGQGAFVSYAPGAGDTAGTATLRFDWGGMPLLATFLVANEGRWMAGGQPVPLAGISAGTRLAVPADAPAVRVTLGGPVRAGIVSAIDRAGNTLRVDLPTGETRVLGIQPQAVMLHDGQAGSTAGLIPGDTVLFETAPGQNAVAILTLVQPALRARVLAVSEGAMTVRFVENERVVMGAVSAGPATFFLDRGMPVSAGGMPAAYQVGEIVWIYSLPQGRARFVLGEVAAGI